MFMLEKKFVVLGTYTDKKTKKKVSTIAEISSGVNAEGNNYQIANTDRRERPIDGNYPVGTILSATISFGEALQPSSTFTAPSPAPATKS